MAGDKPFASIPLPLKGAHNVRDLGGYPYTRQAGECGTTAFGVFLRSGTLGRLTLGDREALRCYGLRRVIDLRSNFELKHWPDPYAKRPEEGVFYTHIPMLDQLNSSGFRGALPACMFDVYQSLLDNDASSIRSVMEALDGPGCSLFHCRAGKDRTGVVAMLLLGLAGVDDEFIVEDYRVTQDYMGRGLRAQRAGVSILLLKKVPRCLFESAPLEMERTLEHLHARYGTAREYLEDYAGCDPVLLDRLTAKLRGEGL
ncbi:tyrosine-protein phosphatase [Collinsella tanakaei]|uniref:tyrosine-protein phosphatase n=1 Tax=Collinsella tanakaei TaxID=626935 RepID=UPI002F92CB9C